MTAMNIIRRRDKTGQPEIILITDGASYGPDGTLLAAAPKVDLLPHFSGFVMHSGGSAWTPAIAAMFAHIAADIDDLFVKAAWILQEVENKFEGISAEPMGRVIFGGWSDEKQQMRLGVIFSEEAAGLDQGGKGSEVIRPDAFTLQEFEGDQLLCQPPIGAKVFTEGLGSPIYDLAQIKDVDEFASFLLTAQRAIGAPHRGVGAFGQITRITRAESSTRIFERYDDVIGEVMEPREVNWPAWRAARRKMAAAAIIPESRLKC
jgi:hypothetical protein